MSEFKDTIKQASECIRRLNEIQIEKRKIAEQLEELSLQRDGLIAELNGEPDPYWKTKEGKKQLRQDAFENFVSCVIVFVMGAALLFLLLFAVAGCQSYQDANPKRIEITVCSEDGNECTTMKGTEQ